MNSTNKWHVTNLAFTVATAIGVLSLVVGKPQPRQLPDLQKTPGVAFKDVTAEDVCVRGYAGKVRNVPSSLKRQVFLNYGIRTHKPGEYEVDHLVSLELGGRNDIENLWPQPYAGTWNAHMKDALENKLHRMVCEGTITLEEAQKAISENWIEAYEKYISN